MESVHSHGHLTDPISRLIVRSDILVNVETTLRSHRYTRTCLFQFCGFKIRVDDAFFMLRGGNDSTST